MAKSAKRGRARPARKKASKGSGVGGWVFAGLLLIGGITVYEHRGEVARLIGHAGAPVQMARRHVEPRDDRAGRQTAVRDVQRTDARKATLVSIPKPGQRPAGEPGADDLAKVEPTRSELAGGGRAMSEPAFTGTWFLCASRTDNCILDADTILHNGKTIRIADIETPATKKAGCEDERQRGMAAMMRLKDVLNQGPFTEVDAIGRSGERAGGTLRVLLRNGRSVGQQLVREGLARPWTGKRQPWCGQKV